MKPEYPKQFVHSQLRPVAARDPGEEAELRRQGYELPHVPTYVPYPKRLRHPQHEAPRLISGPKIPTDASDHMVAHAKFFGPSEIWSEERFPDVVANNAEEEAQYVVQGYLAEGLPDPTAFVAAKAGVATAPQEVVLYPKWVTPPGGEAVVVKSEAEERQLLAKWADAKKRSEPRQGARA